MESIFAKVNANVLIVVVVNSPKAKKSWQQNNELFIKNLIKNSINKVRLSRESCLLEFEDFNDILLVDRNSQDNQIDRDYGVGLARKIGCDIALEYYTDGFIKQPWIYSTDADVVLPKTYFSQSIKASDKNSAIVLDFEHISDDDKLNGLQFYYDFKLRYYRAGIAYAGSAYDYIPLGSTLIVNMECYAQVRGFPKRNAGEDFYLLNKLSKVKPIKYLVDGLVVKIKSRFSDRVPFGTGPALIQINELSSVDDYKYYHPRCFKYLKKWIQFLNNRWTKGGLIVEKPSDKILLELYVYFGCKGLFEKAAKQISSQARWQQFIHQWFDAFKVLKMVHFLDKKYARLNYLELSKTKSFDKVLGNQLYKSNSEHGKI